MSETDSRKTFFRQSGWMVGATLSSGGFMFLVHPLVTRLLDVAQYNEFFVLLRMLSIACIPATGLALVFARKSAVATTPELIAALRTAAKASAGFMIGLWATLTVLAMLFSDRLLEVFKLSNAPAFWLLISTLLATLFLMVVRGILQGQQDFFGLGWTAILDGLGRFIAIGLFIGVILKTTTGAMLGTVVGVFSAIAVGLYCARGTFIGKSIALPWKNWIKLALPLTLGMGAMTFLQNADSLFSRAVFSEEEYKFYSPGWMVGFALTQFTLPIAMVMFPRIVKQAAGASKTDALKWTFVATLTIGILACTLSTIIPWLPVRILLPGEAYVDSAQLVPYFAWALLPFTLTNVLINNLFGKDRFEMVSVLVIVVGLFYAGLLYQKAALQEMPFLDAFKRIVLQLGITNILLMVSACWFTFGKKEKAA